MTGRDAEPMGTSASVPPSLTVCTNEYGLPNSVVESASVTYRSVGIGLFGVVMRFAGMPLEKIALYMNSSQVSGNGQLRQAARLTFQEGALAPYRVVGPASITAWFFQYSVMGFAFQFFDHSLSQMLGVHTMYYGKELMEPPASKSAEPATLSYQLLFASKTLLAPILASGFETKVSNRAEVQRFFGREKFASIVQNSSKLSGFNKIYGPAFAPCLMRNFIMCQTTFVLTPMTYRFLFPQEHKSTSTLFWYGLSMNIFVGNVFAITQQAMWGRSLDYLEKNGEINYRQIVRQGLKTEGTAAFFTAPKWFSRVLMNAPAQGVLPWFYNNVLPLGEPAVMGALASVLSKMHFDIEDQRPIDNSVPEVAPTNYTSNDAGRR